MNGLDLLKDMDLIDEAVIEKNTQPPRRKSHTRWILPIAACLGILLLCGVLLPELWKAVPATQNTLSDPARIIDPVRIGQPDGLSSLGSGASEPPEFTFHSTGFVVTAKVLEVCPDTYYIPGFRPDSTPFPYRLLQLEICDVISGTGLPNRLWYLLPEHLLVDMTGYDRLLISLGQVGFDKVTLENATHRRFETYDLLFSSGTHPHLGDIIAFTDGVFDERLWQEECWHYGYQFGKSYLDHPEHAYGNMVVFRGYTLEETVAQIQADIRENYPQYNAPTVKRLEFQSEDAQRVLAFVRDPGNGLFLQIKSGNSVCFYRYAGGIRTNEIITVDLETEAITRSSAAFTHEELTAMPDISGQLEQLQATDTPPSPPLVDPTGKDLWSYGAYGEYIKADSGVYGIITEIWVYRERVQSNQYMGYYDIRFTLLDAATGGVQYLSAGDLNTLLGETYFHDEYRGTPFYIGMC